ncbi:MAG: Gfo/Idh/MocA family oxidoreductase [Candidatus Berkelbacteria bacterium]|nr:Gfo/Idh/MocA family oxidoreductase [Candidatus Berkelbacteria bacterium]
MGKLSRFLVIGAGGIGGRHVVNLKLLKPKATIAILGSPNSIRVAGTPASKELWFSEIGDAIKFEPDAVIIASPANTHLEYASSFARVGAHLFIEKPLALSTAGTNELIEQCKQNQVVIMVGYNLRYSASLLYAKKLLDENRIGNAISVRAEVGQYLPDWRPSKDYRHTVSAQKALGGGALLELSHELDYIIWMFGMPQNVTARGGKYSDLDMDVEDTVEIIFESENQPMMISIHLDLVQRNPVRYCRIAGENGTLLWDGINSTVNCYDADSGDCESFSEHDWKEKNHMYMGELKHFLECVETGIAPTHMAEDSVNVLRIVHAARQSIITHKTVIV